MKYWLLDDFEIMKIYLSKLGCTKIWTSFCLILHTSEVCRTIEKVGISIFYCFKMSRNVWIRWFWKFNCQNFVVRRCERHFPWSNTHERYVYWMKAHVLISIFIYVLSVWIFQGMQNETIICLIHALNGGL